MISAPRSFRCCFSTGIKNASPVNYAGRPWFHGTWLVSRVTIISCMKMQLTLQIDHITWTCSISTFNLIGNGMKQKKSTAIDLVDERINSMIKSRKKLLDHRKVNERTSVTTWSRVAIHPGQEYGTYFKIDLCAVWNRQVFLIVDVWSNCMAELNSRGVNLFCAFNAKICN